MPIERKPPSEENPLPQRDEAEWDGLAAEADAVDPKDVEILDELSGSDIDEEMSEEDDDNPYQNSDEALPEDAEEQAIARDLWRDGDALSDNRTRSR